MSGRERIVEVLAEHDAIGYDDCDGCLCGADVRTHDAHRAHVADVLTDVLADVWEEGNAKRGDYRACNHLGCPDNKCHVGAPRLLPANPYWTPTP